MSHDAPPPSTSYAYILPPVCSFIYLFSIRAGTAGAANDKRQVMVELGDAGPRFRNGREDKRAVVEGVYLSGT